MSRILDWIERENARSDAKLATRGNAWLVARALIGAVFATKGTLLAINAQHIWQYVLAPVLIAGGLYYAFDSAKMLIARAKARSKV